MTDEKNKRLIVSATVTAVVFLFLLVFVAIYQSISIVVLKNKQKRLDKEILKLEQEISTVDDEIEYRSTLLYIEQRARELGYEYDEDVGFTKK